MTRAFAGTSLLALLSIAVPSTLRAQTASPAAYLPFDEGTGNLAADVSGNGHAATLFGASGWTAGKVGPFALAVPGGNGNFAEIPIAAQIVPVTQTVRGIGRSFDYTFAPHSFTVLEISTH